jgi:hypothetical protein
MFGTQRRAMTINVSYEVTNSCIEDCKILSLYRKNLELSPDGVKSTKGCLVVIILTGTFLLGSMSKLLPYYIKVGFMTKDTILFKSRTQITSLYDGIL